MKIFALLTMFATSIGTLSVEAEDHGEGAPPHWEPVDNARQALHDELGELVENGDIDRIHELIGQLEESFHAAVDAEIQHQHEGQERHRAIDEQFHQEHEEANRAADEAHRAADEARQQKHQEIEERRHQVHQEADQAADQAHQDADRVADEAHRAADEARDQKHQEIEERRQQAHEGPQ